MLNSAEHEILNAHKYQKKYQDIQLFSALDMPTMLFFLLINVKMPTIVGSLTFMSRTNFMLNCSGFQEENLCMIVKIKGHYTELG